MTLSQEGLMIPQNFLEEIQEDRQLEEELVKTKQPYFDKEIKIKKVNISNVKIENIGDYQDFSQLAKIFTLLQEFWDVFAKDFKDMKGIIKELGAMNIPFK